MYSANPCCIGVLALNTLNWCTRRNSVMSSFGASA